MAVFKVRFGALIEENLMLDILYLKNDFLLKVVPFLESLVIIIIHGVQNAVVQVRKGYLKLAIIIVARLEEGRGREGGREGEEGREKTRLTMAASSPSGVSNLH